MSQPIIPEKSFGRAFAVLLWLGCLRIGRSSGAAVVPAERGRAAVLQADLGSSEMLFLCLEI